MIFKITCIPCEKEVQFNSVVNSRPSFSTTISGYYEQIFEQENTHICPFCEMQFKKTNVLHALKQYLQTQHLSVEIHQEKVEFSSSDIRIVLRVRDIIEKDYLELFNDVRNEYLSRNEFGLLKLFISEFNTQQWGIVIQST